MARGIKRLSTIRVCEGGGGGGGSGNSSNRSCSSALLQLFLRQLWLRANALNAKLNAMRIGQGGVADSI